jgi:hypothetical protein
MKQFFNNLKTADRFSTMSLIVLLLTVILNMILTVPVGEKIMMQTVSSMSAEENQIDTVLQFAHKIRYLQMAGHIIIYVAMLLFYAFLLYSAIRISKGRLSYKITLQLIVYAFFSIIAGDLINTGLIYARGLDTIQNAYETSLVGLNVFTSVKQVGVISYTLLTRLNPFQFGYVCLLSIGLKHILGITYLRSATIVVLFWLTTVILSLFTVYLSQLAVGGVGAA